MAKENSGLTKREDKEHYTGCTVYLPSSLSEQLGIQARTEGITKAAYIIKAVQNQLSKDKEEISSAGGNTVTKQFEEILKKEDNIITDLNLLKMLLMKQQ